MVNPMTPQEEKEAAAAAAKEAEEAKAKAEADAAAKAEAEAKKNAIKVGDLNKKGDKVEPKLVPEAVVIDAKRALKEAQREIAKLKEQGAPKSEITKSVKEIADKYDVDEELINEIVGFVKGSTDSEIEEKISQKMKPFEEKEKQKQFNEAFEEHFTNALKDMPEYKDVAVKNVIKSLSLNPDNANKTFADLLQETYGHLVKSTKKPVEGTRPKDSGSAENTRIDYARATRDQDYFAEIMADPALKAQYNKDIHKRLKL